VAIVVLGVTFPNRVSLDSGTDTIELAVAAVIPWPPRATTTSLSAGATATVGAVTTPQHATGSRISTPGTATTATVTTPGTARDAELVTAGHATTAY
jgi:hypothetical protein